MKLTMLRYVACVAAAAALAAPGVSVHTTGKPVKKFIYVPGKIINLVVG